MLFLDPLGVRDLIKINGVFVKKGYTKGYLCERFFGNGAISFFNYIVYYMHKKIYPFFEIFFEAEENKNSKNSY